MCFRGSRWKSSQETNIFVKSFREKFVILKMSENQQDSNVIALLVVGAFFGTIFVIVFLLWLVSKLLDLYDANNSVGQKNVKNVQVKNNISSQSPDSTEGM